MEIFDEKYYLNLEGGILEALGRMFKGGLKLFVYPMIEEKSGEILTATKLQIAPHLQCLYRYLIDNNFINEITDFHREYLRIFPPDALAKLQAGDSGLGNDGPAGSETDHKRRASSSAIEPPKAA